MNYYLTYVVKISYCLSWKLITIMSSSSDFNLWCAFYNKWQPQMDTGGLAVILKLYSDVVNAQ